MGVFCFINVLRSCEFSERIIRRGVCQVTGRRKSTEGHKVSSRSHVIIMTQSRQKSYTYYHESRLDVTLTSRRVICIIYKHLDELMYDDYDLDYSYTPEYTYDLDETYDMWVQSYAHANTHLDLEEDLDEEYTRDSQDYNELAYRHYA